MRRIGEVLLPSIGYGDAAGLPVEAKSAAWIQKRYTLLDHLVAPTENPFYKGGWPVGSTSDDTQLSVAVAEALMTHDGFSLESQAASHIDAYHDVTITEGDRRVTRGWGGSTTKSIERILAGVPPTHSGEREGAGNGIIMKLAPLAYWQAARGTIRADRIQQYDQLTTMTHDSDVARACTRVHGEVLHLLVQNPGIDLRTFRELTTKFLAQNRAADSDEWIERALSEPATSLKGLVERYAQGNTGYKYGFYAPETLAMVYDVFIAARGDFKTAVYYAVNLGGDADSTASSVSAMSAMWSGGDFVAPDDFERVAHYTRLEKLSCSLAQKALKII